MKKLTRGKRAILKKDEFIQIWETTNEGKNGAVEEIGDEIILPSFEELFEKTTQKLLEKGYQIERIAPNKANCVIRVFKHECFETGVVLTYIYGVRTYLKTFKGMISSHNSFIDYKNHEIKLVFCQDEYTIVKPNFVDYYVKLTK